MTSLTWVARKDTKGSDESRYVFEVTEETSKWLENLKHTQGIETVNVITIFGSARVGKSTFMNFLNGNRDGEAFVTDDGAKSFTQGLHVSTNVQSLKEFSGSLLKEDGGMHILLTDNEGTGQKPTGYDTLLGLPSLIIGKVVIFMLNGPPQPQEILEKLIFLADARKKIGSNGKLGHLHIIVRMNRTIRIPNIHDFIFGEESEGDGFTDRNVMRTSLNDSFSSIETWKTLDKWLSVPDDDLDTRKINGVNGLRLSDFDENYQNFFNKFRLKVASQCKESRVLFEFEFSDPATNSTVMQKLVESINDSNDAGFTLSFFDSIQKHEIEDQRRSAFDLVNEYHKKTTSDWQSETVPLPAFEVAVDDFNQKESECLKLFDKSVKSFKKAFVKPERKKLQEKINSLKEEYKKKRADLDLPQLKDDLKEFVNEHGLQFLEKDLLKNNITSKELFFMLRKDEKTLKNVINGKNKAQSELVTEKVYMGKKFEEKQTKLNEAKSFYSGLILEATEIKDDITKLNKKELSEQDVKVKKGLEDVRSKITARHKNFDFPDIEVETSKLTQQLTTFISDMTRYNNNLVRTTQLPDNKLVNNFSVNYGMLFNKDGVVEKKQPLFEFHDAEILYDNSKPSEISGIYFTKESSMESRRTLVEQGGYSFGLNATLSAAGMVGPALGAFSVSAGFHSTNAKESIESSNTAKTSSEIYSLQLQSYPMGVLRVDRKDIHFNGDIVSCLTDIKGMKNLEEMRATLWEFMENYGSHVCTEVILGGVYMDTCKATFKSEHTLEEKECLLSKAYNRDISAGGLIISEAGVGKAGVAVKEDNQSQHGEKEHGNYKSKEMDITFKRKIYGGYNLTSKDMWKESLIYNSNFAVIDKSYGQIIGIWQLLPIELKSLATEFKMTYLNKIFNSNGPWVDSYDEILSKLRNDYYNENKVALIKQIVNVVSEKNGVKKYPSGTFEGNEKKLKLSVNIKPFVEEEIHSQLIQNNWNINVTVDKLSDKAITHFERQQEDRWMNEKVKFFEIEAKKDTDRNTDNMIKFVVADNWKKYDERFLRREWPAGTHVVFVKITWGAIEYDDDGFRYSNNRIENTSGPKAAWFHLYWTASRGALLNAGFDFEEITRTEPMFGYKTIPDI